MSWVDVAPGPHRITVAGPVFECSCGVVERYREDWQAVAGADDHARDVGKADAVGRGCWVVG